MEGNKYISNHITGSGEKWTRGGGGSGEGGGGTRVWRGRVPTQPLHSKDPRGQVLSYFSFLVFEGIREV